MCVPNIIAYSFGILTFVYEPSVKGDKVHNKFIYTCVYIHIYIYDFSYVASCIVCFRKSLALSLVLYQSHGTIVIKTSSLCYTDGSCS